MRTSLHVETNDDLVSVLDRVLDKGIVIDAWARLTLQGRKLVAAESRAAGERIAIASSAVYVGYGDRGAWREDQKLAKLFPYWRRDFRLK
jgi:gas vesicle structural protein